MRIGELKRPNLGWDQRLRIPYCNLEAWMVDDNARVRQDTLIGYRHVCRALGWIQCNDGIWVGFGMRVAMIYVDDPLYGSSICQDRHGLS